MIKTATKKRIDRFPFLIVAIWFVTYLVCQFLFEQKLGWDEVAYMSVARGIAENGDFSARAYTVMGILKYGFPANLINYPLSSTYIALFFTMFGVSLKVAYFSTWLAGLGVCIFLYYISLLLHENKKLSFFTSMAYLFSPGMTRNFDSAMMEQLGCLILCTTVFFLLQDYKKNNFTFLTVLKLSFSMLILWIYKTLYIGFFFGLFVFLFFAFMQMVTSEKIKSKIPLLIFLFSTYGIFGVIYFIAVKFIFLPLAPMMNFTPDKELKQSYADFLGGFFNDFPQNIFYNIGWFLEDKVLPYFIYPSPYTNPENQFFVFIPFIAVVGFYFLLFVFSIVLLFSGWKKFSNIQRLFILLTVGSLVSFNLIFNTIFSTTHQNIWRYNLYYLPLILPFIVLVMNVHYIYIKEFVLSYPKISKVFSIVLIVFCYLPLYLSMDNVTSILTSQYNQRAAFNSDFVNKFIKDDSPRFIYLNDGSHTTYVAYPTCQVFKDATDEQLVKVNQILPQPIEYLFLKPGDWLFENNKEKILKAESIINNAYKYLGHDIDAQIVVYKLNK